jgi:hypothetical protein
MPEFPAMRAMVSRVLARQTVQSAMKSRACQSQSFNARKEGVRT